MKSQVPRVSIGMPVYNGERYLEQALESLLGQSFADFELIISDNASTDATEQICRAFAARDRRICYLRSETNRGAIWNWNRVFHLARGTYFKWAADDDLYSPEFIRRCVAVLDQNPSVVLCCTKVRKIDQFGSIIPIDPNDDLRVASPKVHERIRYLCCVNHSCFQVFGIIRISALKQTALHGNYVASDRVLLAELALRGPFAEIPEISFFHRDHPFRHTRAVPRPHARTAWHDPIRAKRRRFVFPAWRLLGEYCRSIVRAPLAPNNKALCLLQMARWTRWNWRNLALDLALATRFSLGVGQNPYAPPPTSAER